MGSIFDKIKQGASEAGKQAKIAVEVNRLKMQVNMKQKEMDEKYMEIGKSVYQAQQTGINNHEELVGYFSQVAAIQDEITGILKKIDEFRNGKECVCGNTVDLDAKFCANCGYRFPEVTPGNQCACGCVVEPGCKFCPSCGSVIQDSKPANQCSCGCILEPGCKFCPSCGSRMPD